MSETLRSKNQVLQFVEDGTLTPEQAEAILPADSKPPISRLLDESEGSCNRTKRVSLREESVLDLVDEGVLSKEQAGEILGVPADAIAQTLE